ncbi:MAG TPA: hypothetical protein VJM14_17120 [Burkholderiales bacterium]|nr:hypothetical protein [Burkholderiales bacterium]
MSQARPTVEVLSDRLLGVFPALDADDRRLSLALYRRLAEGAPVALPALAAELAMPRAEVERRLAAWHRRPRRRSRKRDRTGCIVQASRWTAIPSRPPT